MAGQSVLIIAIVVSCIAAVEIHSRTLKSIGLALTLCGAVLAVWAAKELGRSFTVRPKPRADAKLAAGGPYRFVRHPIYTAGALAFGGVSLGRSWIGLALTGALVLLWAGKARVEERYLAEQFPEYPDYRLRVRFRFLPYVF